MKIKYACIIVLLATIMGFATQTFSQVVDTSSYFPLGFWGIWIDKTRAPFNPTYLTDTQWTTEVSNWQQISGNYLVGYVPDWIELETMNRIESSNYRMDIARSTWRPNDPADTSLRLWMLAAPNPLTDAWKGRARDKVNGINAMFGSHAGFHTLFMAHEGDLYSPTRWPAYEYVCSYWNSINLNPQRKVYIVSTDQGGYDVAGFAAAVPSLRLFNVDKYVFLQYTTPTYSSQQQQLDALVLTGRTILNIFKNRPTELWYTLQSQRTLDDPSVNFRRPSQIELRVQASIALCYGAKGISWFVYGSQSASALKSGSAQGSPTTAQYYLGISSDVEFDRLVSLDRNPWERDHPNDTAAFANISRVNQEIMQLAPEVRKLRIYNAFPGSAVPPGNSAKIASVSHSYLGTNRIEVGTFKRIDQGADSTNYFMLVNRVLNDESGNTAPPQSVTVTFNQASGSWYVEDAVAHNGWIILQNGSFTDVLNPGQGKLYKLAPANFTGTTTIPVGATLTATPGVTAAFAQGVQLLVNGRITAIGNGSQRIIFTRSGTSNWSGIVLNDAENTSLQYCDINYALSPIVANSVGSLTISNVNIGNSSFSGYPGYAAMSFYGSSPTISYVVINGQTNSWNGVRFAQGSGGSMTNSTIQSCGAGNGIVVEGNSTPTISNNTIQSNHYHGIVLGSNSTFPLINGNTVSSNGGTNYCGILFDNAHAVVKSNTITGSAAGIYAKNSSFPRSWSSPYFEHGDNVIQSNGNGMVADNNSDPDFGYYDPEYYYGNCNQIYSNTSYDVYATNNCYVSVQGNYWIYSPPTRFLTAGGSYIDFDCYLTSADCGSSICGDRFTAAPGGSLSTGVSLSSARRALVTGDFQTAESQYATIISQSTNDLERVSALHGLYQVFLNTKSPDLIQQVASYKSENNVIASISKELEIYMNAGIGDYDKVKSLAKDLRSGEIAPELDQRILTQLAWLGGHFEKERETAMKALAELREKYGTSVDEGLLAAIGSLSPDPMITSESTESSGQLSLASYPNPFNPSTEIRYQLQQPSMVTLIIFDLLGREMQTLINAEQSSGFHSVQFDGSKLASGLYFARLSATPISSDEGGAIVQTIRLLLTK